jgi:transposase
MPAPLALPPPDADALAALRARFERSPDPETRLRYQMVLLAAQGHAPREIAPLVLRSRDTVTRVLRRYVAGGLDAVPRRAAPGRAPTVTPAWEAELLRVIELDPHAVGVPSANWTTGLLAGYLARATGIAVDQETVRRYLHARGYVCKRPTWTLKRKAADQEGYLGNG